ncbi:hypothetical protein DL96DRAFT_702601 [Flagelloscypha sp. PMI_526]|nr:hypothetical protein DL96DRAFT_702601 [Flagelloscypha sp. PMI_526]
MFLSECLRLASQDVRLYRLQLNEKALQWLLYAWHVTQSDSSKLNVNDILLLLSTICSFERRIPLIEPISLPQCRIVEVLVEFHEALVAREFVLYAKLPVFRPAKIQMDPEKESNQLPQTQLEASPDDDDPMGDLPYTEFDLVPAREGREKGIRVLPEDDRQSVHRLGVFDHHQCFPFRRYGFQYPTFCNRCFSF